jgi:K+-transporting ATPase ATPase C chain
MSFIRRVVWPAIAMLLLLTLLTGAAYPAVITAVAQVVFPSQANGSMLTTNDGRVIGSSLIGQCFDQPQYFWGRPSAAGASDSNPCGYDANSSAGSNLGPTSETLLDRINAQVADWQAKYGNAPIPVDLVTTSASGLDPDISPAAAEYQLARVAAARGMTQDDVRAAVARHTQQPLLGFLGEARVNVLELNLDLDGLLARAGGGDDRS